jgi:hypothetical protein
LAVCYPFDAAKLRHFRICCISSGAVSAEKSRFFDDNQQNWGFVDLRQKQPDFKKVYVVKAWNYEKMWAFR